MRVNQGFPIVVRVEHEEQKTVVLTSDDKYAAPEAGIMLAGELLQLFMCLDFDPSMNIVYKCEVFVSKFSGCGLWGAICTKSTLYI